MGTAQTSTTLSLGAISFQHGQPISIEIGVNPSAATGTVAISTDQSARGSLSSTSQLSLQLANGQATANWSGFPGGTYNVYASYGGDGTYGGSISTPQQITVMPEDSVLRLSVIGPDGGKLVSLAGQSIPYGTYISVDAQPIGKSAAGSSSPVTNATGTVTFTDTVTQQGAQGSGTLDATGNAEFPLHYLGAGTHTVTASYWGDSSYNASTSAAVTFTVLKAGTATSITANANSVSSGSVMLTATVQPTVANSFAQLPGGTVTFTDSASGAVLGTTASLAAARDAATGGYLSSGSITVPVSRLTLGSNGIVATYSGDANYTTSASTDPRCSVAIQH